MFKYFLAVLINLIMCGYAYATLQAPAGLEFVASSATENSLTLIWERPDDKDMVVGYHVYMDGEQISDTNTKHDVTAYQEISEFYKDSPNAQRVINHSFHVEGLLPGSLHTFTVRAYDTKGEESPDSNSVQGQTENDTQVINAAVYGAVGDGVTVNTQALQQAIDACPVNGTLFIPKGIFKTGSLWLKSNMTLLLDKDAVLLGSENAVDYEFQGKASTAQARFYALLNAGHNGEHLENIRIIGKGIIDGNGWKQDVNGNYLYRKAGKEKDGQLPANHVLNIGILAASQMRYMAEHFGLSEKEAYQRRSSLVLLRNVKNLYISGITFRNPANHGLIVQNCQDVVIADNKFKTYNCNNGDGIELTHSRDITVFANIFDTGDDCINFSAGLGQRGAKGKPTEHIWIFNNSFHHGHGMVVAGSHTAAGIKNILAEDNIADGCDIGLRLKTAPANGGDVSDILFRFNAMRNMQSNGFIFTSAYSDPNAAINFVKADKPGCFHDLRIENCTIDGTKKAGIEIVGVSAAKHHDIVFKNVIFTNTKPWIIKDAKDITFTNVVPDYTRNIFLKNWKLLCLMLCGLSGLGIVIWKSGKKKHNKMKHREDNI